MAASTKQPFPVEDFSGGITDEIFGNNIRCAERSDNFCVTSDTKLQSRSGSVLDDVMNATLPIGNARVGKLINYARNEKLFVQAGRDLFYRDVNGVYQTLHGPTGNQAFSVNTSANYVSASEWNKQLFMVSDSFARPIKVYKDDQGSYQLRSVGLPALSTSPTVTAGAAGAGSYIYAFIYSYKYKVNQQSFIELGPQVIVQVDNAAAPDVSPIQITGIPALTNDASTNYDTANVHVQIYRTINNGTNFYLVAEIVNGTATYSDTLSDTNLQTKAGLYTNDGTLDYNAAPSAKFVHVIGNTGLYGYTSDANGPHPYRIHQSVPGNPGFVPEITWVEVESEVKGLNSVKSLPLAFCQKMIYRLDGLFQSSGQGGITPVKIHNTAGCVSNESAVQAENYCFWAGNDGFYATDGYQVIKISDHLNQTYQKMLRAQRDPLRIQGRFDEINRRVYWAVQTNPNSIENDTLFCLHLQFGVSPKSTFTTWSGSSFRPSSLEMYNGMLHRGDPNGFVFRHDSDALTDPKVDVSKTPSLWAQETIRWTLRSVQLNFGGAFFRKFVSRILLQAENAGNTSIQITAINDQGKRTRTLKPIRWRRNVAWGDETVSWGAPDCVWNAQGLIEQWRRFPARGLRLSYLQLEFTNALGIVTTSATDGRLILNKDTKTATLQQSTWPSQSVDYVLQTAADGYTRSFPITAINTSKDTITVQDAGGFLPASGTYDWQLMGYEKGEPLSLIGYTLHWDNVDQNQGTYQAGDSGGAA